MDVELGPEHDRLIEELYALRGRMRMREDERVILDMAIQMVERLERHAGRPDRPSQVEFTFEDFERLICSGGFELIDGPSHPAPCLTRICAGSSGAGAVEMAPIALHHRLHAPEHGGGSRAARLTLAREALNHEPFQ